MFYILFDKTGKLITRFTYEIHGSQIPDEAIEVPERLWWATIDNQSVEWRYDRDLREVFWKEHDGPSESEVRAERESRLISKLKAKIQETNDAVIRYRDELDEGVPTQISAENYKQLLSSRRMWRNYIDNPSLLPDYEIVKVLAELN